MDDSLHEAERTGGKLGMWLFLATELFLFVGPVLLYSVYRYRYPASFHEASQGQNLFIGAFNTAVLLTSSLTMALSITAVKKGARGLSLIFLMLTIFLGAVFLVDKYFEWSAKFTHGIYPGGPALSGMESGKALFWGLYFFMTGIHALHVFAGLVLLAIMAALSAFNSINRTDHIMLENSGLYWHAVDVIWIYLFPLFYLIG